MGSSLSLASPPNRKHLFPTSVKLCPMRGQGGGPVRGALGFSFFHIQRLAWGTERVVSWSEGEEPPLACPPPHLQLVQAVAVLPKLHHPPKHQHPRAFADKTMGSTTGRDVPPDRWQKPLL